MKTSQDNDVTNHIGAVYAENNTELPWLIKLDVVYFQN